MSTSIENKIEKILVNLGIRYIKEYEILFDGKKRRYDFYVEGDGYKFFIECDGEYYHPYSINESTGMMEKARKGKLSRMQKRNMLNDIFKNKIAESVGIKLIRLREYDINKNQDKVIFTIKEEISKQTGAAI